MVIVRVLLPLWAVVLLLVLVLHVNMTVNGGATLWVMLLVMLPLVLLLELNLRVRLLVTLLLLVLLHKRKRRRQHPARTARTAPAAPAAGAVHYSGRGHIRHRAAGSAESERELVGSLGKLGVEAVHDPLHVLRLMLTALHSAGAGLKLPPLLALRRPEHRHLLALQLYGLLGRGKAPLQGVGP